MSPFDEAVSVPAISKALTWQQSYNDGREDYYKNDFERAHQHFSEALRKCPKPEDQEQIFYNLGNTCYQQSQLLKDEDPQKVQTLTQSVQNYRSALSLDKEAKDTPNNLKMAERELNRVRKKQNDNKDNNDNNDGSNKNNKGNKDNKSSNDNNNNNKDNKDNRNDQQEKNDNKDQNQGQQNQGQQNPENKDPQDQKEQNQPQDQSNPQNQPQQQQESPDKNQESPSSSQPQPNPNAQQQHPKPQAGGQAPQPGQDPKEQEIKNILKKAANSERMFPQANQAGTMDEPILKDW